MFSFSRKIKLLKIWIYSEFRVGGHPQARAADRPAWRWPPEGVEREGKPAATPMKMWPVRPWSAESSDGKASPHESGYVQWPSFCLSLTSRFRLPFKPSSIRNVSPSVQTQFEGVSERLEANGTKTIVKDCWASLEVKSRDVTHLPKKCGPL